MLTINYITINSVVTHNIINIINRGIGNVKPKLLITLQMNLLILGSWSSINLFVFVN